MNPTPANSFVKQIPNLVTLSNLACGLIGITMVMQGHLVDGFFMMVLGAIMDFFDGAVARLLKANSPLGLQLDSLADVVTFGVLPGLIWREEMQMQGYCSTGFCINNYVWLLIPLAAAYRLAKFNVDTRQTTGFIGVPTPITGIALGSWALISASFTEAGMEGYPMLQWIANPIIDIRWVLDSFWAWLYMPLIAAYLMTSELPLLAMKFKANDPLNTWKKALFLLALPCLLFGAAMVAVFYFMYVIISVVGNNRVHRQEKV